MSKYTVSKQGRTHGAYARRLQARGLNHGPKSMPFFRKEGDKIVKTDRRPANG